jgi:hypothetical protein
VYGITHELGPTAKKLLTVWSTLPRYELVPYREAFDPMVDVTILPVLTIFERGSDQVWRFRLAGTEIDRRWGRKVTGLAFTELTAPDVAPIMQREFDEIVRTPCGAYSLGHVEFDSGRLVAVEFLRLPLRARDGSVSLILSCAPELPRKATYQPDVPVSVGKIATQQFFDIGGGIPSDTPLARAEDDMSGE